MPRMTKSERRIWALENAVLEMSGEYGKAQHGRFEAGIGLMEMMEILTEIREELKAIHEQINDREVAYD